MRKDMEQSLGEVLQQFIETNKLEKGLTEAEVIRLWPEIMGPGVANYTKNIQFSKGVLKVYLSSSVLREELLFGRKKIIAMYNEALSGDYIKSVLLV
jgi:hypothetical protein